ncbi:MAG: hypothetical protein WA655_05290, partial [Candidatus Korobacteraceae bacterium]
RAHISVNLQAAELALDTTPTGLLFCRVSPAAANRSGGTCSFSKPRFRCFTIDPHPKNSESLFPILYPQSIQTIDLPMQTKLPIFNTLQVTSQSIQTKRVISQSIPDKGFTLLTDNWPLTTVFKDLRPAANTHSRTPGAPS